MKIYFPRFFISCCSRGALVNHELLFCELFWKSGPAFQVVFQEKRRFWISLNLHKGVPQADFGDQNK